MPPAKEPEEITGSFKGERINTICEMSHGKRLLNLGGEVKKNNIRVEE
jgi:hypothetical protein